VAVVALAAVALQEDGNIMNSKQKKFETIANFLYEAQKPFKVDDIFAATGIKKSKKDTEEIERFIQSADDFIFDRNRYHPKISFLKDIPIRIRPTEDEIQQNILIPGHRFLPFCAPGISSDNISIVFNGKPAKRKEIKLKMEEILFYHNLMDFDKIPILNIEDVMEPGSDIEIEAFNLKKFYSENRFKSEDFIVVRVLDFNEGIFSVEYDSQENFFANLSKIRNLDKALVRTLKKVMDCDISFPNTEKQMLYTYYHLKKIKKIDWDWNQPGTPLGPLLGQNKDIHFSSLPNGKAVFHFSHQSIDEIESFPDFNEIIERSENQEIDLESIEGILAFLSNNNGLATIRALLFQQISANEEYNYKAVEDYLFYGLEKPYMDKELRKKFKKLIKEEYNDIKKTFDLKNAFLPITTLRDKILKTSLEISIFLRSLDNEMIELDELPKREMMHLSEMDNAFYELLMNLEDLQLSGSSDASQIHSLSRVFDKAIKVIPSLLSSIREQLGI